MLRTVDLLTPDDRNIGPRVGERGTVAQTDVNQRSSQVDLDRGGPSFWLDWCYLQKLNVVELMAEVGGDRDASTR